MQNWKHHKKPKKKRGMGSLFDQMKELSDMTKKGDKNGKKTIKNKKKK